MKVGLSTWSLLGMSLTSAVELIGESGFDYVELWGEVPHAYPDWMDKRALKDSLSSYDFTLTMHAPFTDLNPATPFQPVRGAVERSLVAFVELARELGASVVTLHPGSVHNEAMVPRSSKDADAMIHALVQAADGQVKLSIENQSKGRSRYSYPVGSTVESVELLLASNPGAAFTLDTGHAHSSGLDPKAFSERFKERMVEIHLSDNAGAKDEHLFPGEGTANLKGVIDAAKGTDVLICLEINPFVYATQDVIKGARAFKDRT